MFPLRELFHPTQRLLDKDAHPCGRKKGDNYANDASVRALARRSSGPGQLRFLSPWLILTSTRDLKCVGY